MDFPGGASGKEPTCQCRRYKRHELDPWVRKVPRRREWQSTPVFLLGESHEQKSLEGYSLKDRTESDTNEATQHAHTHEQGWATATNHNFQQIKLSFPSHIFPLQVLLSHSSLNSYSKQISKDQRENGRNKMVTQMGKLDFIYQDSLSFKIDLMCIKR